MTTRPTDGWVHVRDEPNHFHRYENEYVRVYDVRFPGGHRCLYHRHDEDTLYVAVYDTRWREQRWGEDEQSESERPAGSILCRLHRAEPLTHAVQNLGNGLMRMIGAEVKNTPPVVSDVPLEAAGHTLLEEQPTPRLRLYRITLQPDESTGDVRYGFSGLTIFLSDANLEIVDAQGARRIVAGAPGDNLWHDGPQELRLTNLGPQTVRALLGEWC
jgi:hypothetical protein